MGWRLLYSIGTPAVWSFYSSEGPDVSDNLILVQTGDIGGATSWVEAR